MQGHGPRRPFALDEIEHDALHFRQQDRRGQHRHERRREHDLQRRRVERPEPPGEREDHETELSSGRQGERAAQGVRLAEVEKLAKRVEQDELHRHHHGDDEQHQQSLPQDHQRIEKHADGDEEEPQQHVAERLDVVLDLVSVLGLRDQHAGEEGAQREREPGKLGEPGESERGQQHGEHEQLGRLLLGHEVEQRAHHALAQGEHDQQHHQGLHQRQPDRAGDLVGPERQRRDQHQDRDDREVLEQQHAHDQAAMPGLQLACLRKRLADDGGGRHRGDAAQHDRALPGEARGEREARADRHRDEHLQAAQAEHHPSHRQHLRQAELEAHREHQEHHAELREVALVLGIGDKRQRIRADHRADDEIAEDRRHGKLAEQHHHGDCRGEEGERDAESVLHG